MTVVIFLAAFLPTGVVASRSWDADILGIVLPGALMGVLAVGVYHASPGWSFVLVGVLLVALAWWELEQRRNRAR